MLEKSRNRSVFTVLNNNEKGFTLISMLMGLSFLALVLPFLLYALTIAKHDSFHEELSVQQFFTIMRVELAQVADATVDHNGTRLNYLAGVESHADGPRMATIELYDKIIRRQVDGRGHEVYLRNVKSITFEKRPYGVHITILGIEGGIYEKSIVFYGK